MAEQSYFWNTSGTGDGAAAGYARDRIAAWLKNVFSSGIGGILDRVGNELEVTGSSSPLAVDTGAAIVDGLFYYNTASAAVTVSTPSNGTTGGRVVLRADWSAQTVRIAVVLNTDGVADIPALTQNSGTTYEISLATFTITTGGVIGSLTVETARAIFASGAPAGSMIMSALSVLGNANNAAAQAQEIAPASDGLAMRRSGTSIGFGAISSAGIADGAVNTDQIEDVAIDDTKLGNRVPQFYRRQGGSASDWDSPGSTDYTPGKVIIMAGSDRVQIQYSYTQSWIINLPVAVSHPLIFLTIRNIRNYDTYVFDADLAHIVAGSSTGSYFYVYIRLNYMPMVEPSYVYFNWMVIGPVA